MIRALSATAIVLLLSQQSFANEGFYIGGAYHKQLFSHICPLSITHSTQGKNITNITINDRSAENTKGTTLDKYKPNYTPPFAANILLGYAHKSGSYKTELELMHSKVKVDNIGLMDGPISISYKAESDLYAITTNTDSIENTSLLVNAYRQWKSNRFSFSPYVGVGGGVTRMKMFEKASIRPAYQLKAGLSYQFTEDTNIHIGYRHFGVIGGDFEKFKNLKLTNKTWTTDSANTTTTIKNKFFGTHGFEVGMTIHFASKDR
ncbi:MAG: P44/Msp2 family outer membrane protein [Wolbachia endosymbiont of Tyrophagus putrescentiae]|nr:P44/Msp2 family outer membrane protein [Wolbachia endosymbiont of Tyrophagus putrescentiae]